MLCFCITFHRYLEAMLFSRKSKQPHSFYMAYENSKCCNIKSFSYGVRITFLILYEYIDLHSYTCFVLKHYHELSVHQTTTVGLHDGMQDTLGVQILGEFASRVGGAKVGSIYVLNEWSECWLKFRFKWVGRMLGQLDFRPDLLNALSDALRAL